MIQAAGASGLSLLSPTTTVAQSGFGGKYLFCLQLDGGLDVTSYCDPKMNVTGEREINTWARSQEIQAAGNILYAPFANNSAFFDSHYQNMLVINGVDAQTNAHSVGILHNWSGRNSDGYPSLTALYAASNAPQLPMSYLNFGGFGATGNIIRSSRISKIEQINNLLFPNQDQYDANAQLHRQSDFDRVQALQLRKAQERAAEAGLLQGSRINREIFAQALEQAEGLSVFADVIPPQAELQPERQLSQSIYSTLHQQMQISLLAMQAGVTVAADLFQGGFDTHAGHDSDHTLLVTNTNDAINYFWTYAEELGLADRIVLVIGSDFGRTPHYNSGAGKDHWPIGSYIVMERNVGYTNRVFGETDEGHNSNLVNLQSGRADTVNGAAIYPKHVHLALRKYLGIHKNQFTSEFPFSNTEDFQFFG